MMTKKEIDFRMSRFAADVIQRFRDIDPDWSYITLDSRFDDGDGYPYVWLNLRELYSFHLKMLAENYHFAIFAHGLEVNGVITPTLHVLIRPKEQDK